MKTASKTKRQFRVWRYKITARAAPIKYAVQIEPARFKFRKARGMTPGPTQQPH